MENFIDYSKLSVGQLLCKKSIEINSNLVKNYLESTQDSSEMISDLDGNEYIPPMAIAAFGLQIVIDYLKIPHGTKISSSTFKTPKNGKLQPVLCFNLIGTDFVWFK